MLANKDFKDLFSIFNEEKVEYIVVGAHAVIYYAEPRYTKDLDVWVNPTRLNAKRVWKALKRFGAPLNDVKLEDFCDLDMIYQIGIEPNRIDVLMGITGVVFENAWKKRTQTTYDKVPIPLLSKEDLLRSKKLTARKSDLLDVERLENS